MFWISKNIFLNLENRIIRQSAFIDVINLMLLFCKQDVNFSGTPIIAQKLVGLQATILYINAYKAVKEEETSPV